MKNVLITGASSGLGLECAKLLANKGHHVFAGYRKKNDAIRLGSIENITPIKLDVTSKEDIHQAYESITQQGEGSLFALINNAGIVSACPLEAISEDDFREQLEVNFFGAHFLSQKFIPLLRKSGGRIINMSSIAAQVPIPSIGARARIFLFLKFLLPQFLFDKMVS